MYIAALFYFATVLYSGELEKKTKLRQTCACHPSGVCRT